MKRSDALILLLGAAALARLYQVGTTNDADFHVYWKTAHAWLAGESPYAYTADDRGFVIKYPPWTLPLFLPLGLLGWKAAQVYWFLLEVICVFLILRWVIREGRVERNLALLVAALFWWIFQSHFAAGQVVLPLGAAAVWAFTRRSTGRMAWLAYVLSVKVHVLVTLAGFGRKLFNARFWAVGLGVFIAAHGVLIGVSKIAGLPMSLSEIYRAWIRAASSSGAELGVFALRGPGNHGIPALVLRHLGVDPLLSWPDNVVSVAAAFVFGGLWHWASLKLENTRRLSGWLALGVLVHPLAWQHFYVLVYPLCCFAVADACSADASAGLRRVRLGFALAGTACIGLVVPPLFGTAFVEPLELWGLKLWGVALAAAALCWPGRSAIFASPPKI